jgi:hypothetical protein
MTARGESVITQTKSRDDSDRRIRDTAALKNDFVWWSFYWSRADVLTAVYLGVGPVRSVTGYTADEVRTKIEQLELHRSDELARLRHEFPGHTIWQSESGMLYAMRTGPQHTPPLIPVLEANTASELRRLIAGCEK